jgi:hypothetical protein
MSSARTSDEAAFGAARFRLRRAIACGAPARCGSRAPCATARGHAAHPAGRHIPRHERPGAAQRAGSNRAAGRRGHAVAGPDIMAGRDPGVASALEVRPVNLFHPDVRRGGRRDAAPRVRSRGSGVDARALGVPSMILALSGRVGTSGQPGRGLRSAQDPQARGGRRREVPVSLRQGRVGVTGPPSARRPRRAAAATPVRPARRIWRRRACATSCLGDGQGRQPAPPQPATIRAESPGPAAPRASQTATSCVHSRAVNARSRSIRPATSPGW